MVGEDIQQPDEALKSPFGRMYLAHKPEQIINCAMGLQYPIHVDDLKSAILSSTMVKHPRFCSLMVRDHHNGVDSWKKTNVNIDDHIIIHHHSTTATGNIHEDDVEAAVNAYLADLAVSTTLSENKPLWEVHALMGMKCVVLRVHHAVCDGASLMSMLSACFGEQNSNVKVSHAKKKRVWRDKSVWGLIKSVWFTLLFGLRLLGRVLWVKDNSSVISGGDGVELWPRKLATLKFKLDDFRSIKKVIPNATVNDVLLGLISCGLSKYLEIKSPQAMLQRLQVSGLVAVNLRNDPGFQEMSGPMGTSSWGNKTGLVVLPVYCCNGLPPLEHVRTMKAIMDQKKQSYEAYLTYKSVQWMSSCFGPKAASWLTHRILCNTTFLISNIMGPSEEMAIGGNPVTYLRINVSSLPQAITMHMVSYGRNADLQVMVAKDIIHDPQFLAKCFQESLDEVKDFCTCENGKINDIV